MRTSLFTHSIKCFNGAIVLVAAVSLLLSDRSARGQSDNFDDGDDNGWVRVNVLAPFGGNNTYSFPNGPFGKGYRVQCTSVSALGSSGTARALTYRTNEYTDFYVAVDLVNWNNSLNQALVLVARMTGQTNVLSPCPLPTCPPGFGTLAGYICNYDANQNGAGASNPLLGQFQINRVANEGAVNPSLAAANVTLIPGKSYRMIFKGVADLLTAQLYDLEDLSAPLVTVQASDATYPGGVNGIISFSRDATTTDATFDNYFAAASDPNVDIAPAIRHPVPGTPQVVTRTPTNRFENFVPSSTTLSFTARTFATNEIDAGATRLYLNNVDVSPSLTPLPPNGSSASFAAAGVLADNTVYAARIELQNTTGTLKSTNIFWFDTLSDAYLSNAPVKTVELEDYNYTGGSYQLDPIPVSGYDTNGTQINGAGVGYLDLIGMPEVDYHDNRTSTEGGWNDYRSFDFVGTLQGNREELRDMNHLTPPTPAWVDTTRENDHTRQKYAALGMKEYGVARTEAGEWLNYTRSFADTNYYVFLRCGSYGVQQIRLDLVSGDTATTNQTTTPLGAFSVQNHYMHRNGRYEPLLHSGVPVVVHLAGTNTLRVTMGGNPSKDNRLLYLNYLLFVPTDTGPTVFDNFNDGNDTTPAWTRLDPLAALGAGGTWSFPNGNSYRIQATQTPAPQAGPGRAASILPGVYSDFYESVDILAWDDTVRQVFGLLARVTTPGLGTTSGYLFSWERGDVSDPNGGDLDISRLDGESPTGLATTGTDKIHFETNKQYRITFAGVGGNFTGKVYELPDTANPVRNITATDSAYASGQGGLVVANNNLPSLAGGADATFDNFLVTTAEPKLTVTVSGGSLAITWPLIPYTLQSAPALSSPTWTSITNSILQVGDQNSYITPVSGAAQYFRLVYP